MPATVHLWLSNIAAPARQADKNGFAWLSGAEQARLPAFGSPGRRRQFLAGHWLLRELLASVAGGSAHDWRLCDAADSAPTVLQAPPSAHGAVRFKLALSHSGNWVACAVAETAIGLDIEDAARRRIQLESLAPEVLSPAELQRLHALPAADQVAALRHGWTLKEAWLKARGEGVSLTRLPQLHTQPVIPVMHEYANARLWSCPQWSLALALPADGLRQIDLRHNLDQIGCDLVESDWLVQDWRDTAGTAAR